MASRLSRDAVHSVERYSLLGAAGVALAITVLHPLGVFEEFPKLEKGIPLFGLVFTSAVVLFVVVSLPRSLEQLDASMSDIGMLLRQGICDQLPYLRSALDVNLERLFGDHFDELLSTVARAVEGRSITIYDVDLYRFFHKRTLQCFPTATFLATSLPYRSYFWANHSMEEATESFIARHGKIIRVFFIESWDELLEREVKEILDTQYQIGVTVYVAERRRVPRHLRSLFMTDASDRICWVVAHDGRNEIVEAIATSDAETARNYRKQFQEILALDTTREYTADDFARLAS